MSDISKLEVKKNHIELKISLMWSIWLNKVIWAIKDKYGPTYLT